MRKQCVYIKIKITYRAFNSFILVNESYEINNFLNQEKIKSEKLKHAHYFFASDSIRDKRVRGFSTLKKLTISYMRKKPINSSIYKKIIISYKNCTPVDTQAKTSIKKH